MGNGELTYSRKRLVDPFFEDAINQIYMQPTKQIYLMDGPVATGKSNNFTFAGPYDTAQHVVPHLVDGRMVRKSVWAAIRESENSAVGTIMEILEDSVFPPDVIYKPNSPVKKVGSHPTHIVIKHELADGTFVDMDIECHGFNNPKAEDRLRSRSYVGAIILEVQGIPWSIVEVARQRTGRWRPSTVRIEKTIDGELYVLSGVQNLKMVFADANIPRRPHPMYEVLYDRPTLDGTPYLLVTPPSPILPHPVDDMSLEVKDKYPCTRFEGKDVVWLPNPKVYFMTKHFETDVLNPFTKEQVMGNDGAPMTVPWSGYSYWFSELNQSDSIIRRHILGKPDTIGGEAAVYTHFDTRTAIVDQDFIAGRDVWVGYDNGKYSAFIFLQHDGTRLHIFHEIIFDREDAIRTRGQVNDFVAPYVANNLSGSNVYFVNDPAGKNDNSAGESAVAVLNEAGLTVRPCLVANQDTVSREANLGYFIDRELITVSPHCKRISNALSGGYCYRTTASGLISDRVDKNIYSHAAEALQYAAVNLYRILIQKKVQTNAHKKYAGIFKARARR
jgi:hypothetical protein